MFLIFYKGTYKNDSQPLYKKKSKLFKGSTLSFSVIIDKIMAFKIKILIMQQSSP
jgi:hypothetical protein